MLISAIFLILLNNFSPFRIFCGLRAGPFFFLHFSARCSLDAAARVEPGCLYSATASAQALPTGFPVKQMPCLQEIQAQGVREKILTEKETLLSLEEAQGGGAQTRNPAAAFVVHRQGQPWYVGFNSVKSISQALSSWSHDGGGRLVRVAGAESQ